MVANRPADIADGATCRVEILPNDGGVVVGPWIAPVSSPRPYPAWREGFVKFGVPR